MKFRMVINGPLNALSVKRGDLMVYISGLKDLIELKKGRQEYRMILHTDQGSVYTPFVGYPPTNFLNPVSSFC